MTLITTQCVVPHSVRDVCNTIITVQEYPQFIPGCDSVRLMDQGDRFLMADTSVSGFIFRTRMHWSETDGGVDVFFNNTFVHGVWHVVHGTPEGAGSDGAGGSENGCTPGHHAHIELRITIKPGLFSPILRMILPAALPSLQRAFQKRLDDGCDPF